MKALIFLAFLVSASAFSQENPFAHCEKAKTNAQYLNCKIEVFDDAFVSDYGTATLEQANAIVDEECSLSGLRLGSKVDPKLMREMRLQCELEVKSEFYFSLEDN